MRHRTRVILFAVAIALALFGVIFGAVYGLTEFFRPAKNISDAEADITVEAPALFAAFESNEKEANEKYVNKVVAVTGPVGEVSTDQSGASVVVLRTPEMMFGVACTMLKDQSEKVAQLKTGQRVTVKGLCTGYTMDVVLNDGSLVE
jgi:hypothetical protein